jgi:hypothetical protein
MARKPDFDHELERLQRRLPAWARRTIKFALRPDALLVRLPLAIALIGGGFLGFLPILGFWMLPLGLALLAFDLPFLRGPLARVLAFINKKVASQAG